MIYILYHVKELINKWRSKESQKREFWVKYVKWRWIVYYMDSVLLLGYLQTNYDQYRLPLGFSCLVDLDAVWLSLKPKIVSSL